ncbi:hypothetical protein RB653_010523 [Dictyostelium firmibasis]|uniref:Uncharacterized protein n=1 Tax=Dictyostelium firmibasis TaxID=79012 RepID=A0AAN7YN19_9MYCE
MFEINKVYMDNASEVEKQIISKSKIKKIDKEVLPVCASPASNVSDIDNFAYKLNRQFNQTKSKIKKESTVDTNSLPIRNKNELVELNKLLSETNGNLNNQKTQSFINDKLKVDKDKNLYGVGRYVDHVYCIFGKYQLKKSVIKVTKPDPNIPISSLDLLAIYTKAYQHMYKEQEQWFDYKKTRINISNSPHGIYRYGINDIHYNGLSTIIEFDTFLVCSFDVDPIK